MKELKPTHPQISDGGIGAIIERVQKQQSILLKKKYKMIQVSEETHTMLKKYCDKHGFKISGLLSALIKQYINKPKG